MLTSKTPKKEAKTTEEKVGSFVAIIDDLDYAQLIIDEAQAAGLTVAGDNKFKAYTRKSVDLAEEGHILEFFGSGKFDISLITDPNKSIRNNFVPVYTVSTNLHTILYRIKQVAKAKKELLKAGWPTVPTYRSMILNNISYKEREDLAKKNFTPAKTEVKKRIPKIKQYNHMIEIEGNFIPCNPNDTVYYSDSILYL
jgi:hypothetical protein